MEVRENKGDDMAKDSVNDEVLREKLKDVVRHAKTGNALSFRTDSAYAQAIIWASERIAELESKTQSPEKSGLESPDSEEEIHQRRRRERMLDEVTLICVNKEVEKMSDDAGDALDTGFRARDMAKDIWMGINEFDLQP